MVDVIYHFNFGGIMERNYDFKKLLVDLDKGGINAFVEALNIEPYEISNNWSNYDPKKRLHGAVYSSYSHSISVNPYNDQEYETYSYVATVYPKVEASEIIAENGRKTVIDIIEQIANLKANKDNYKTTDEAMKQMREFLTEELEKECNRNIKLFQEGKISKIEFDSYVRRYNNAKEKLLPKMENNWIAQQALRDEMPQRITEEEEQRNRRAMLKANAKATAIKIVKSPITLAKFLKAVLKTNKELSRQRAAERRLQREAKKSLKRQSHIEKTFDDRTF